MAFFNAYWQRHNKHEKTEEERDEEHFAANFAHLTGNDSPPVAFWGRPPRQNGHRGGSDARESARAYYNAYYQI